MISISRQQLATVQGSVEEHFVDSVRRALTEAEPGFLPRFPVALQRQIARLLIQRAQRLGAGSQDTVGILCCLMVGMAANLGTDPAVRAWLAATGGTPDDRIRRFGDLLSDEDWSRIEGNRSSLELLTPPDLDAADVVRRTAAALPLALWDAGIEAEAFRLAEEAVALAVRLGLAQLPDAPLALAIARRLYAGQSLPGTLAAQLQDPKTPARERLGLLRQQVMADHRRWS